MSDHDDSTGNGEPPSTPPVYARQLEVGQFELEKKHSSLKSLVAANHIAVLHQIGDLANQLGEVKTGIFDIREDLKLLIKELMSKK